MWRKKANLLPFTCIQTHLCSSDHSSTSPHRRHRVRGCRVPYKQTNTQILFPFSSKSIMTRSPLFSKRGRFLEVVVVNAKLTEFSSSLHMQSASCMMFELEIHKTHTWNQEIWATILWVPTRTSEHKSPLLSCQMTRAFIGFIKLPEICSWHYDLGST